MKNTNKRETEKMKSKKEINKLILQVCNGLGFLFLGGFATLGVLVYSTIPNMVFFNVLFSFIVVCFLFAMVFVKKV